MSPGQRKRALVLRRQGLSITAVAERLGVPRSTVGDWLRGVSYEQQRSGILAECAWSPCGDLFFTTNQRRRYCCREHTVKAAHAAASDRGTR